MNSKLAIAIASLALTGVVNAQNVKLSAAGATFPYPIYSKWFNEFASAHKGTEINYQSIGSGGGIRQLTEGTVDFGASDKPLSDAQETAMKVKALHFPTVLGAVVPTYNVPGVSGDLKFTGDALAGIFLGTITKWNDPALAKANPGVKLPADDIVVVHRSDGSGTTFVFVDYLAKVSPAFKAKIKPDTSVSWPVGLGAKGNEGVSGMVRQTPNSIGYVELIYALQNKMGYGEVKNSSGAFVKADLASVTAAAAAVTMPADFKVSITNASGAKAYPISTFTWLLIPTHVEDAAKRKAITDFLHWMLTKGQTYTQTLGYAPLPAAVVSKETQAIAQIK